VFNMAGIPPQFSRAPSGGSAPDRFISTHPQVWNELIMLRSQVRFLLAPLGQRHFMDFGAEDLSSALGDKSDVGASGMAV
jgi:hypothetical protein